MQNIKAVFDIGNGFIKGAIFAQDEGKNVLLLKEMVKTKGMRKGKILDSEDFIISINTIIETFIKKLGGEFIDEVYIGISHPEMIISRMSEQKRVMTDIIKNEDVDHLSRIISEISQKNNYETLKILPVYWLIDENKKEKDPVGLQGKRLELVADVFYIPKNFYNNLIEVFEKLNLNIIDIVPNILAASESALDFDLKDLGTVLIDIGTNQTSFVVYEEGFPLSYGVIPIGGEDVTKDISICLQIDIKEAEEIKKEKGMLSAEDQKISPTEETEIGYLSSIITARYEEIFNKIQKNLHKIGKDGRLPGGVILMGGGAKAENLDQFAKHIFKLATFYGKDKQMSLGELSNNLQFINIIGNYIRSNKYVESRKSSLRLNFDFFGKIGKFIKEIF
ncbi:MAG TPA: cell division protein FtsA [Candidatus Absconditabacterales bacterium]|nr:cell division protein FtsA [Candidatus Absconditabacterales bacterium]HMT26908.1 cell division protein FtsA [Candidatus Absconditabacterales bacterium]